MFFLHVFVELLMPCYLTALRIQNMNVKFRWRNIARATILHEAEIAQDHIPDAQNCARLVYYMEYDKNTFHWAARNAGRDFRSSTVTL